MTYFVKAFCFGIGAAYLVFSALGSFGIGHFRVYYGPDANGCTKMESKT